MTNAEAFVRGIDAAAVGALAARPRPLMQYDRHNRLLALLVSVALHALVLALAGSGAFRSSGKTEPTKAEERIIVLQPLPPPEEKSLPRPERRVLPRALAPLPAPAPSVEVPRESPATNAITTAASSPAAGPAAPTAEEWAFAARYTLKNSKGYRYAWGKQVRSLMGAAPEGPDQGVVRFRVEIAPDGTLAKLETLWTTSDVAEQRARKAIESMPPLPPTPTGKPLIFERTISFSPSASDPPPIYRDDCLPDPPAFGNPFAWDGKSAQARAEPKLAEKPDPQAYEECLKQLPRDSFEAEDAYDKEVLGRWGSSKLGR